MKLNNFRGDLADNSAKKEALVMVPAVGSDADTEEALAVTSLFGVARQRSDVAAECARSLTTASRSWAL